jgi:hypothetical protein
MTQTVTTDWGPFLTPVHENVPDKDKPWKDNSFFCFWDPAQQVRGVMHVSTSPNGEGRRARLSVLAGNTSVEVVEPLDSGTWTSASITFAGGAGFTVDTPDLKADLVSTPQYSQATFSGDTAPVAFGLDKDVPLTHFGRPMRITGTVTVEGREIAIDGEGFRDRTWGYRDESSSLQEYYGFMFVFEGFGLHAFRLVGQDGSDMTFGYRLDDDKATPVTGLTIVRDASGLMAEAQVTLKDGTQFGIRSDGIQGGFWCPMGWTRPGPCLSAYDEFHELQTSDGLHGFGLVEQGVLKQVP